MTSTRLVVALDIGVTKLLAGVVGEHGSVRAKPAVATEAGRGPERVLERALDLAEEVWREAERQRLRPSALGASTKGITREDGVDDRRYARLVAVAYPGASLGCPQP